uniref:RNA helicase n=1 Tax=Timspurckia oligopyrenoides TaxID=708627 RepID=A0A7S0ZAT2_9RHOD|mmetsp:Transcript_1045/g.1982  ORF Transcript_1045/g.1982 Transcript_1045/m.1982 type:complete len:691 (+) Transcript_1045:46-2118(+)
MEDELFASVAFGSNVNEFDEDGQYQSSDSEAARSSSSDSSKAGNTFHFEEDSTPLRYTATSKLDLNSAIKDTQPLHKSQTTLDDKIQNALQNKSKTKMIPQKQEENRSKAEQEDKDCDDEVETGNEDTQNELVVENVDSEEEEESEEEVLDATTSSGGKQRSSVRFEDLKLSRGLLKAIAVLGWNVPTPIQEKTIPAALSGRDICGSAVTGSGKTGAFALPILERLVQSRVGTGGRSAAAATRVIMLLPSRELAVQCHAVVSALCRFTGIRAALTVGGLDSKAQEVALRGRPDIVVATPGRLIDHVRNTARFSLEDVEVLVIDEADRMLEFGFKDEMDELMKCIPSERQTLLFSATLTKQVEWLVNVSLHKPLRIAVDATLDVAATLRQEFVRLRGRAEPNRDAILIALLSRTVRSRTIIFFAQKHVAHRFQIILSMLGLRAAELHGNLTQAQRLDALQQFRDNNADFLLCTDLAARGLDIEHVHAVVNYNMPRTLKEYVHRVGRTARAGRSGRSISLVDDSERKLLADIHKRAKDKLKQRTVPLAVVEKWRERIDGLDAQVKQVLQREREEKELRVAQMEAEKAVNMLEHADEIKNRPPRTWFQSNEQKVDLKKRMKRMNSGDAQVDENKSAKNEGRSDKKMRLMMEKRKEQRKEQVEEQQRNFDIQRRSKKRSTSTKPGRKSSKRSKR